MTASTLSAAAAYAAGQRLGNGTHSPLMKPESLGTQGDGFQTLLQGAIGNVQQTGRAADQVVLQAAAGKNDLVDVVTAVAESEAALETLVSVRDRVIAAYEEIMRMPI